MTLHELRAKIRRRVPPEAFAPRPLRGVWALGAFAFIAVTTALLWWAEASLPVVLAFVLVHSLLWTQITAIAHEASHGSVFRTPALRELTMWAGFGMLGFGPEAWRGWHIRSHHAHTNDVRRDPDVVGIPNEGISNFVDSVTMGSGRWSTLASFLYLFSAQALSAVWRSDPRYSNIPMNRRLAKREIYFVAVVYLVVGVAMGPWYAFWLLLVPIVLNNANAMLYVYTQHYLRPSSSTNDPLANTMSVGVPGWVDWLHMQISYHREHHIFPSMSHASGPKVRKALNELGIPCEPLALGEALRLVFRTPRLYTGSHVMQTRDGKQVDLHDVWRDAAEGELALIDRVSQSRYADSPTGSGGQ